VPLTRCPGRLSTGDFGPALSEFFVGQFTDGDDLACVSLRRRRGVEDLHGVEGRHLDGAVAGGVAGAQQCVAL
jgi:hypothetical protein